MPAIIHQMKSMNFEKLQRPFSGFVASKSTVASNCGFNGVSAIHFNRPEITQNVLNETTTQDSIDEAIRVLEKGVVFTIFPVVTQETSPKKLQMKKWCKM